MDTPHDRAAQVLEWKHLTEEALPAMARQYRWPLRLDHCFKRVCLDHAFGDVWYRHVKKPAERHLSSEDLGRAVQCARDIARDGKALLKERNDQSLQWREKGAYRRP